MGKRQALKKLLHPHASPPASPPSDGAAIAAVESGTSLASGVSGASSGPSRNSRTSVSTSTSSTSSAIPVPPGAPNANMANGDVGLDLDTNLSGLSSQTAGVALTDAEIHEDVVLEQMAERNKTIGAGQGRAADGVSPDVLAALAQPPLPEGAVQAPRTATPSATAAPTTAPASAPANAPVNVTAQQLAGAGGMYGGGMYAAFGGERRGGKKSSKQKFAERQAKKKQALLESAPPSVPGWDAHLEQERQDEIRVIAGACDVLGREIFEIAPDGHCMYSAIADQLGLLGLLPVDQAASPYAARQAAAAFMRAHRDDFLPFLASVGGEDMPGATDDGVMTDTQFGEYCHRVESTGEWGGEPEITALTRAFGVPIHVIQRGPPTVVSHGGADDSFGGALTPEQSLQAGERVVRISYHRRMYGLGEHYNSLRPAAA
ncbi:OTU protein [Cryptotrichosporon argae]